MDTGTLFSNIADQQTYATDTSATEESAASTGNDRGPSGTSSSDDSSLPMMKIMQAVMRGAGKIQGQEQAKAVVNKQAANSANMKVTMEANPNDPGNPLLTIKNVTADKLNGTEASDVQRAYTTPSQQVEKKLAAASAAPAQQAPTAQPPQVQAPTTPPPPDHPLEQAAAMVDQNLGYRMARPWDSDIAEKLQSEDGIRQLAEEMGDKNPRATAHQAWRQLQHGKVSAQAVQQRVANFRLQRLETTANRIEQTMAPSEREADRRQAQADRLENQRLTRERLNQQLTDAEIKAGNEEKLNWLRSTNLATIDPDKLEETAQASTNASWTAADLNRARLKQQQDINKDFLDYTDTKKDLFALGAQPTWEAARAAFGHPLTPQQDSLGRARWQAAHNYAVKQQAREDRAAERENDQHQRTLQLLANASKEKPVHVPGPVIERMDASEIVSMDPDTVKNYDGPGGVLATKEGYLRKEIADATDKRTKAGSDEKLLLNASQQRKLTFHEEGQLVNHHADRVAANARVVAAQAELQQIQAARAARRGGGAVTPVAPQVTAPKTLPPPVQVLPKKNTPATPPRVGDTKLFTSGPYAGKTGTWTGSAWAVPRR